MVGAPDDERRKAAERLYREGIMPGQYVVNPGEPEDYLYEMPAPPEGVIPPAPIPPGPKPDPDPIPGPGPDPINFPQGKKGKLRPHALDQLALLDAVGTPVNTYYPWEAKPQAAYIDPIYDEPNYYPIQSAQRQRMDMMNQVSSPQMARANGSYMPDQIMGIIGETQRARGNNIQSGTAARAANAQIYNNLSAQHAQIDSRMYDKTIMSLEARDQARKLKSNDVRGAAGNLVNNYQQARMYEAENPQYGISGAFWENTHFKGGKDLNSQGSGAAPNVMQLFSQLKDADPSATIKDALDYYEMLTGKTRTKTTYPGMSPIPSSRSVTQFP
jgi:hypothetical protein